MQLPPLIGTPFVETEVKNEVKSVQNLRKQAAKSNTSLSMLSFLHYSEQIRTWRFATRVSSIPICRLKFRNWSILRRLPLLHRNITVEILSLSIPILWVILLFTDT